VIDDKKTFRPNLEEVGAQILSDLAWMFFVRVVLVLNGRPEMLLYGVSDSTLRALGQFCINAENVGEGKQSEI
jgi:hypothetical protein